MNKAIFGGLLAFLLFSCRDHVSVNGLELHQIFNEIITTDSTPGTYFSEAIFIIDSIKNFDTREIVEENISYKIAYCDMVKNGTWNKQLFNDATVVSREFLHLTRNTDTISKVPPYYRFSLPYFSEDKNSFLIYYSYYCGFLCAEYSLRLYKKVNGKWRYIKNYFYMVS